MSTNEIGKRFIVRIVESKYLDVEIYAPTEDEAVNTVRNSYFDCDYNDSEDWETYDVDFSALDLECNREEFVNITAAVFCTTKEAAEAIAKVWDSMGKEYTTEVQEDIAKFKESEFNDDDLVTMFDLEKKEFLEHYVVLSSVDTGEPDYMYAIKKDEEE